LLDLMGATNLIYARTFDFHIYLVVAVVYLIMVEGLRWLVGAFEKQLVRHLRAPVGR
jgi:polar amino acid transport system permease protein